MKDMLLFFTSESYHALSRIPTVRKDKFCTFDSTSSLISNSSFCPTTRNDLNFFKKQSVLRMRKDNVVKICKTFIQCQKVPKDINKPGTAQVGAISKAQK